MEDRSSGYASDRYPVWAGWRLPAWIPSVVAMAILVLILPIWAMPNEAHLPGHLAPTSGSTERPTDPKDASGYGERSPRPLPRATLVPGRLQPQGTGPAAGTSIDVGADPLWSTYDPRNGYLYVVNYGSNNVSVINGTTVVGTVNVGTNPWSATYDGANGYIYVPNSGSDNVSLLNGAAVIATVGAGDDPICAVYDSMNHYIYVVDQGPPSYSVMIFNGTTLVKTLQVGTKPYSATYDASNGWVYVADRGSNSVSVINGTTTVDTIGVGSSPGDGVFDSANGYVYFPNLYSQSVSVIDRTRVIETLNVGVYPESLTYDTEDGEVYVAGLSNVSVINATKVVGTIAVGITPESAGYDAGNGYVYVANYGSANLSLINGTQVIGTISVGSSPIRPTYDPGNGYMYISDLGSNNMSAIFTGHYVTFGAKGLPNSSQWSIVLNGTLQTSGSSSMVFGEPDGNYSYTVLPPGGYAAAPASGFLTVHGGNRSVSVAILFGYAVTFTEIGLPGGTDWSITIDKVTIYSNSTLLEFGEPNGTLLVTPSCRLPDGQPGPSLVPSRSAANPPL